MRRVATTSEVPNAGFAACTTGEERGAGEHLGALIAEPGPTPAEASVVEEDAAAGEVVPSAVARTDHAAVQEVSRAAAGPVEEAQARELLVASVHGRLVVLPAVGAHVAA